MVLHISAKDACRKALADSISALTAILRRVPLNGGQTGLNPVACRCTLHGRSIRLFSAIFV